MAPVLLPGIEKYQFHRGVTGADCKSLDKNSERALKKNAACEFLMD